MQSVCQAYNGGVINGLLFMSNKRLKPTYCTFPNSEVGSRHSEGPTRTPLLSNEKIPSGWHWPPAVSHSVGQKGTLHWGMHRPGGGWEYQSTNFEAGSHQTVWRHLHHSKRWRQKPYKRIKNLEAPQSKMQKAEMIPENGMMHTAALMNLTSHQKSTFTSEAPHHIRSPPLH